jgi:hypothetical protein
MSFVKIDPTPFSTQTDNVNYILTVETSQSLCETASSYTKFKKTNPMPINENVNFAKIVISPYYPIQKYEGMTSKMKEEITSISESMKKMILPENIRDQNIAHNKKTITFNVMYKDTQKQERFNFCMDYCFSRINKFKKKEEMINDLLCDVFNGSFPSKVSNIKLNHIFIAKDCFTDKLVAINIKETLLNK